MAVLLQAPMRSMIAITIPILSRAWKEKDQKEINRIYRRSSINLLSFSLFMFFCIWLNLTQAIEYFGLNAKYIDAKWVFFLLGLVTIVEMGTGVNGQIIGTSSFWRFELWTSLLLTILIIPLSYFLTSTYGLIGPAIANLISFSIYNFIRFWFLWKKFDMQPFSLKTVEVMGISILMYGVVDFFLSNTEGLVGLFARTISFGALFISTVYIRDISPDFKPVVNTLLKKMGLEKYSHN
jgi:O-antigen/teichoic acid export membrane protein